MVIRKATLRTIVSFHSTQKQKRQSDKTDLIHFTTSRVDSPLAVGEYESNTLEGTLFLFSLQFAFANALRRSSYNLSKYVFIIESVLNAEISFRIHSFFLYAPEWFTSNHSSGIWLERETLGIVKSRRDEENLRRWCSVSSLFILFLTFRSSI